ncbi:MAG TPA: hypothetical protein VK960_03585 [Acidimicrobiia bacterium]|nr:hypothetical protein [Acidimicrobiia bacterium]
MSTASVPTPIPASTALAMEPHTRYHADGFWTPVDFLMEDDGWWSLGWDELWVHMEHRKAGRTLPDLDLSVIAQAPTAAPGNVIEAIAGREHIEVIREPRAVTLGGRVASQIDVSAAFPPQPFPQECPGNALLGGGGTRFAAQGLGVVLLTSPNPALPPSVWAFGLAYCRTARIWVVDVDGSTITIIAAPTDPGDFDELIGLADAFVEGIEW